MSSHFELKQKIIPVKVPWQVSPSTPHLRLQANESSDTEVTFVAHFLLENDTRRENGYCKGKKVIIANNPHNLNRNNDSGPYQLVKLTFKWGLWARMSPSYSDGHVLDPDKYDDSFIPCKYKPGQDIRSWLNNFWEEWRRTSLCPNPGMYQVENSVWISEVNSEGYKHYIIIGHDAYIEVLAKDWQWQSEGALKGW